MVDVRFLASLLLGGMLIGPTSAAWAQTETALLGYPRLVVPGTVLRFETTEGVFRVTLFEKDAPGLTRVFRDRVAEGSFRRAGFWLTRREGVQLGSPMTDVTDGGAQTVYSRSSTFRPPRDAVSTPFMATLGAHGFERTGLPTLAGSVMIDQRFIESGQLLRREYFIALSPGFRRGEVVGQVIEGLDVVRRLNSRDAILNVQVE